MNQLSTAAFFVRYSDITSNLRSEIERHYIQRRFVTSFTAKFRPNFDENCSAKII